MFATVGGVMPTAPLPPALLAARETAPTSELFYGTATLLLVGSTQGVSGSRPATAS